LPLLCKATPIYDSCFDSWFEGYLEPASEIRTAHLKKKANAFQEEYKACVPFAVLFLLSVKSQLQVSSNANFGAFPAAQSVTELLRATLVVERSTKHAIFVRLKQT